ncbi:serine/threonine-protein kinase RsbW [Methanomicrobium sp. W14]|uniref:ATP-binding protein n=1 Tax=Methanomicrobium sp. W14 TaxID=2817839 RepID=UPI001AE6221C|nr:ATP-binding protein [Methanomicrobium sp. W14]MBP2132486.1 serine/threonine-protein kinase RsbW [Methanomicrobium sp. W14]
MFTETNKFEYSGNLRNPAELIKLLDETGAFFVSLDISERIVYGVRLVLEEVLSNIIVHGYHGNGGYVYVSASVEEGRIRLQVKDRAQRFNPKVFIPHSLSSNLSCEWKVGGVGIRIIKEISDKLEYIYENGENCLLITKRLPEK